MTLSPARWRIGRKTAWITALAALLLLAGLCLYRQFGSSPLEPCANDPALVRRIIRETAKAAKAIKNGQGTITETLSGGAESQFSHYVTFSDDRFRIITRAIFSREMPMDDSVVKRLSYTGKRLLAPRYSDLGLWPREVCAWDGRQQTNHWPDGYRATVAAGPPGMAFMVPLVPRVYPAGRTRLPLGKVMVCSAPTVVGWQRVGGSRCVVVEQTVRGQRGKALARCWVCVEDNCTVPRAELEESLGNGFVDRTTVLLRGNGHGLWTPARVQIDSFDSTGKCWFRRTLVHGSDFQFNLPARKLHLSLRLPRGTKVHDEILKRDYVVK